MNHVKKMILVPHESVARMHDAPTASPQTQMSALDSEMTHILNKQYVDDSEKWKRYNEALQRFLHFSTESRKPISIQLESVEGKKVEEDSVAPMRAQLSSVIPKTYKEQALKIFDYLCQSGAAVTWDTAGTVTIGGAQEPHTNIIDLISDLTRFRKNIEPTGVGKFILALARMNIPLELIGNEKRRNAIHQAKQSGGGYDGGDTQVKKRKRARDASRIIPSKGKGVESQKGGWKTW